jgi:Eukaryotic cytochrome b561
MAFYRSFLATLVTVVSSLSLATTVTAQSYSCSYPEPVLLDGWGDGDFYMEQYANYDLGTITMRLTYDGGNDSWVAIGINTDGGHSMENTIAVIGDVQRGVKFYWMTSEARDASGVLPQADIHGQLQNTSFRQENGQSILEFTMNLAIADEDEAGTVYHEISEDSAWIWGAGLPGNQWQGIHRTLGYFSGLVPHDGCVLIEEEIPSTPAPTGGSTSSGTAAASTGTATESMENEATNDSNQGTGGTSSPASQSTSQIVFGQSGNSSDAAGTRGLWVSHGILMAIAWGVFAPLAVGASYLKKTKFLQKDALWLCLHFYLSFAAVIFTVFGFVFAILATQLEGDPHFKKDTHHKAGLAIVLLVIVQALAGFFRPSPNTPKSDADNKPKGVSSANSSNTSQDGEEGREIATSEERDADSSIDESKKVRHPWIRQCWEYFHRFLGISLLALAWYNCNSGIELQAEKYQQDDEQTLMSIFWSITGLIAGVIFLLGYVIRVG